MSADRVTDAVKSLWTAAGLRDGPIVASDGDVVFLSPEAGHYVRIERVFDGGESWRVLCRAGGSSRHTTPETAARGAILALVAARMNRALGAEGGET